MRGCVLAAAMWIAFYATAQAPSQSASLHGSIHDEKGNPIAHVVVVLGSKVSSDKVTTYTDTQGHYNFTNLHDGVYTLEATTEAGTAHLDLVFLKPHESKTLDLTLASLQPGKAPTPSIPQFFDEPQFTVAGVTDTTNLGGHGSDTIVRTRDSLAKETASLSEARPKESSDADARANAQRLLATHETADLHHVLADLDEKLGDSLEAVRHYQRAAELDPSEAHLFDWGAELLLHHAPEPAAEVFSNGTRKYPSSSRMLLGLGAAAFARGDSDGATRRICQASDLNPADAAPYLFLGKIEQSEITPPADLVEKLHRFATLQPQNADANYYYAVALWKRKSSRTNETAVQAESLLKAALKINPKYAPAELQLGIVHSDQGDYASAVADYQKAIQIDPQLEEAHYRLAQAYREIGQPDKAKEELRIYGELAKQAAQKQDRERREIKQFVYTLRDQPESPTH